MTHAHWTGAILRKLKPEKHERQIDAAPCLPFGALEVRAKLVLDTNVYIDMAPGRLARESRERVAACLHYYSVVALTELMQGVAGYSSNASNYGAVRRHYLGLFKRVPRTRLLVPDADVWMRAGAITGLLSCTQGFRPHQRKKVLLDALIYLDATKRGLPVLTRNVRDFGLIAAVHGSGVVVQL